jgi:hypothetical protein
MTNLLSRRAARVLGSAAALWIVPASAADLAIRVCPPDTVEVRSTAGKKIVTARPSFYRPVVHHGPAPTVHAAAVLRERQNIARSDVWSGRQFVMLVVGIAY